MNKIIIVDDHSLFREGIKLLIENEHLGEVIAEASNGQEFLDLLQSHRPDLVIMDIEMPVMNGLEATKAALGLQPDLKVLILTMLNEKANYASMIYAGAMGFVLKTAGKKEFEKAIQTIGQGESYFSTEMMRQIILKSQYQQNEKTKTEAQLQLTDREIEVLKLLGEGYSVAEIAEKIFLSAKTIESHRAALLRKTQTKNTLNLVLFAIKNKLIEL